MKAPILATAFLGGLCAALLCGCSTSGNPLPEGMEEDTLLTEGRSVVELLNEEDYAAVHSLLREDAAQTSTQEDIARYMGGVLEQAGPYEKESEAMATGQKLDSGEEYGTAVFYCKHQEKDVLYRIAFDLEMDLMGLEIKLE